MKPEHCVQKNPPLDTILNQANPLHTFTPYFINIRFNTILQCTPRSPKLFVSSGFPIKILYAFLISPMHTTCLTHIIFIRNGCTILVGKPEGRRQLRRPSCRWDYNIRIHLSIGEWEIVGWIHLAQDMDLWQSVLNKVINLRVH